MKKLVGKVLYLLSFVVAAIITCLIFNSLVYDIGGLKNKVAKITMKDKQVVNETEEIRFLGVLHMKKNYGVITNVIFSNGCIHLNEDGEVIQSFKYDYSYSLRHLQEFAKYDLNDRYWSHKMSRDEIENFVNTRFYEVNKEDRKKVLNEIFLHKKIEVYDIKAETLTQRELQEMMRLMEEQGISEILNGRNRFLYWGSLD